MVAALSPWSRSQETAACPSTEHPVLRVYAGLRTRILERLRKVNGMTEQGALDAGGQLQRVVAIARAHIEQLRDVVMGPMVATDSSLRRAIATQGEHVRTHGARLDQAVAAHAAEVVAVATAARMITAAAKQIGEASAAASALSINARIESSRAGVHVFKAIATELHSLAKTIVNANNQIQDLAEAMEKTLPKLVEDSDELRRHMAQFMIEARSQIDGVDQEILALTASIEGTLKTSDQALAAIIATSYDGLSALQFQDVCAQSLLQIDAWQAQSLAAAGAELGVAVDVGPVLDAVSKEEDILERSAAGEVMLF